MPRKEKAATFTLLIDPETCGPVGGIVLGEGATQHPPPEGLPRVVTIRGQRWRVVYYTHIYGVNANDKKATPLYGFCHEGHRLIVINSSEPRFNMIETLYHELAHVYLRKHTGSARYKDLMKHCEEELCDLFAEAFADFTTNNPPIE